MMSSSTTNNSINYDSFPVHQLPFIPTTQPPSDSNLSKHNYANLRLDIKHNNKKHNKSKSGQRSATVISHATRIEPTNLSYKDLLRKHQFTPSAGSCSASPMKQSFDSITLNEDSLNLCNGNQQQQPLKSERAAFLKRPIIEEPKKSVSAYQLFAKSVRTERPHTIPSGYSQSKALSILWTNMDQNEKDEWTKKSEQEKIKYHHQKEEWLNYVSDAKRLVCSVAMLHSSV